MSVLDSLKQRIIRKRLEVAKCYSFYFRFKGKVDFTARYLRPYLKCEDWDKFFKDLSVILGL